MRIKVRSMLILVALAAVLCAGVVAFLRSTPRAKTYRGLAYTHASLANCILMAVKEGPETAGPDELARLNRSWSAYHAALRRKYEYAASHPWFAVAPDPPDPVPFSNDEGRDVHVLVPGCVIRIPPNPANLAERGFRISGYTMPRSRGSRPYKSYKMHLLEDGR